MLTEAEYLQLPVNNCLEEVWIGGGYVIARVTNPVERDGKRSRLVSARSLKANVMPEPQTWAPGLPPAKVHVHE